MSTQTKLIIVEAVDKINNGVTNLNLTISLIQTHARSEYTFFFLVSYDREQNWRRRSKGHFRSTENKRIAH